MSVPTLVLKEFVRKIYRYCDENDLDRDAYLDGMADCALETWENGKTLSSSSGNGITSAYEMFYGWNPEKLLDVIGKARDYVSQATLTLALAEITPVRHASSNFTSIYK